MHKIARKSEKRNAPPSGLNRGSVMAAAPVAATADRSGAAWPFGPVSSAAGTATRSWEAAGGRIHPVSPRPAAILNLQRKVGNMAARRILAGQAPARGRAAVPNALRGRGGVAVGVRPFAPSIQRFEADEHKKMGDLGSADKLGKAQKIKLSDDLTVTFGDITAMAGDIFGSAKVVMDLAKKPGSNGQEPGTIDEVKYALLVEVRGKKGAEDDFSDAVKNAVAKRYYTLAGKNITHFTNPKEGDEFRDHKLKALDTEDGKPANNAGSYLANHLKAIEAAVKAGSAKKPMDTALLYEAFASHFLTDAYASGHIRTARSDISAYWNPKVPMFWTNLKWWMAEKVAQHINDNTGLIGTFATVQILWEKAMEAFNEVLKAKGIPDLTFGDVISGAVHDYDNHKGLMADVGGAAVKLVGDGKVLPKGGKRRTAAATTEQKAAAGVAASLADVRAAYARGKKGERDADKVINSLLTGDGLFRAEQIWPKPLPESDPRQTTTRLNWKVRSVETLFRDRRMREALAIFAKEKAASLGSAISFKEAYKKKALEEGVLDKLREGPKKLVGTFREIINYTPGAAADLGGVGGHDTDDNALEYYKIAKKKGALGKLTFKQKAKLIRLVLEGATRGLEETMILDLLGAKRSHAPKLIRKVGWRWIWKDLDGKNDDRFIRRFGRSYWRKQSYKAKRSEVKWLADGYTSALAQETIIIILRTCSARQVRKIDDQVGGFWGLAYDLTGKWDTEFKKMKRG